MDMSKRKQLDRIPIVTASQIEFGKRIGIDCSNKTVEVAWAMIEDVISRDFWRIYDTGVPTEKKIGSRWSWHQP
jgi:hypothetical protein